MFFENFFRLEKVIGSTFLIVVAGIIGRVVFFLVDERNQYQPRSSRSFI